MARLTDTSYLKPHAAWAAEIAAKHFGTSVDALTVRPTTREERKASGAPGRGDLERYVSNFTVESPSGEKVVVHQRTTTGGAPNEWDLTRPEHRFTEKEKRADAFEFAGTTYLFGVTPVVGLFADGASTAVALIHTVQDLVSPSGGTPARSFLMALKFAGVFTLNLAAHASANPLVWGVYLATRAGVFGLDYWDEMHLGPTDGQVYPLS